jgi:hypothetical protein
MVCFLATFEGKLLPARRDLQGKSTLLVRNSKQGDVPVVCLRARLREIRQYDGFERQQNCS